MLLFSIPPLSTSADVYVDVSWVPIKKHLKLRSAQTRALIITLCVLTSLIKSWSWVMVQLLWLNFTQMNENLHRLFSLSKIFTWKKRYHNLQPTQNLGHVSDCCIVHVLLEFKLMNDGTLQAGDCCTRLVLMMSHTEVHVKHLVSFTHTASNPGLYPQRQKTTPLVVPSSAMP